MDREKIAMTLRPMEYANVELKPGPFKEQFDRMLEYFLALPDDDILLGFRRRAGLSHPGRELGGWYSNDGSFDVYDWDEIFNAFGQWLSLLGRAYRATGDQRLSDKARRLITAWGRNHRGGRLLLLQRRVQRMALFLRKDHERPGRPVRPCRNRGSQNLFGKDYRLGGEEPSQDA